MIQVIATIGPASRQVETLTEMIRSGMTIARINLSHGDYVFHTESVAAVRQAALITGKPVVILADLQGAKVRIGRLDGEVEVADGQELRLIYEHAAISLSDLHRSEMGGSEAGASMARNLPILPVDFDLAPYVKPGTTVLIDDGLIELRVDGVLHGNMHGAVCCTVIHGGTIKSRKGVNVPYVSLPIPALTDKDRADVTFAVGLGVDWIALSFAGSAADVAELHELVDKARQIQAPAGSLPPRIMAKIERPDGVRNLDELIDASDAVMVARGDLALETSPWELPLLQKQIVKACMAAGKPVVVATQMLESMIQNHRPTRAEVSDVANALLDGADAVMLSGETAMGAYPVYAVRTMSHIIGRIEGSMGYRPGGHGFDGRTVPPVAEPHAPNLVPAEPVLRQMTRQRYVL